MQKIIFTFIISTYTLNINAQSNLTNPYLKLKYDSVIVYDFVWYSRTSDFVPIIDSKGNLAKTVKKKAKLDNNTIGELSKQLGLKSSYGEGTAFCFEPHFGIVYYKGGKPVAYINVCFACNILDSNLRIPAQEQGKQGTGDESYYVLDGMSKSFRKYLNTILKRYNFSHQADD
jgi:hypothetical protein